MRLERISRRNTGVVLLPIVPIDSLVKMVLLGVSDRVTGSYRRSLRGSYGLINARTGALCGTWGVFGALRGSLQHVRDAGNAL